MREVKPIKDGKKLGEVVSGLSDYRTDHEKRIYIMFMIGICTGLRIGDILRLKVSDVNHGDIIRLKEEKTGKLQEVKIGQRLREVLDAELQGMPDDAFLFPSRRKDKRGRIRPITTRTAENDMHLIKEWFGISFPFSCHSMRKTFGYWHYKDNRNLAMLAEQFNHADLSVTSRYIGLDEDDKKKAVERLYLDVLPPNRKAPAKKRSNQVNTVVTVRHHDRTAQKEAFVRRMQEGLRRKKMTIR